MSLKWSGGVAVVRVQERRPFGEGPQQASLILYSTALIMLRKLCLSYKPLTTKGFAHNSEAELFNPKYPVLSDEK